MGYKTKFDGNTDKTIQVGGVNSKTNQANPATIEGYFLGSKDTQSDYGPGKLHIFQTSEGTIGVWGKTRMDKLLTSELVGQMVLVTFTGMIAPSKKGRRPSYGYKVQHDPENTIDTSTINLSPSASDEEDSFEEEESFETEAEEAYEEPAPARAVAPKVAAVAPDASRQAKVQALLNKSRNKTA